MPEQENKGWLSKRVKAADKSWGWSTQSKTQKFLDIVGFLSTLGGIALFFFQLYNGIPEIESLFQLFLFIGPYFLLIEMIPLYCFHPKYD